MSAEDLNLNAIRDAAQRIVPYVDSPGIPSDKRLTILALCDEVERLRDENERLETANEELKLNVTAAAAHAAELADQLDAKFGENKRLEAALLVAKAGLACDGWPERREALERIAAAQEIPNHEGFAVNSYRTIIVQNDDTMPPSAPVLEVDVIGKDVFLTFSRCEETADTVTYTKVESVMVPLRDLMHALNGDLFYADSSWRRENYADSVAVGDTQP